MKKKNKKKIKHTKVHSLNESTIHQNHYTKFGEHPEDRIFRDREYIQRIQKHVDSVYDLLVNDLRLNDEGYNWLFDYIFNSDDNIEFEEFLAKYKIQYCNLIK
jgi:hypothetical protein